MSVIARDLGSYILFLVLKAKPVCRNAQPIFSFLIVSGHLGWKQCFVESVPQGGWGNWIPVDTIPLRPAVVWFGVGLSLECSQF